MKSHYLYPVAVYPISLFAYEPVCPGPEICPGLISVFSGTMWRTCFIPEDDSLPGDDGFTPDGLHHWTWSRYRQKITALAKVIIAAGGGEAPELVGLCEVENGQVLEDLVTHPILSPYQYSYFHQEGQDHRGMELACLCRTGRMNTISFQVGNIPFRAPVSDHQGYNASELLLGGRYPGPFPGSPALQIQWCRCHCPVRGDTGRAAGQTVMDSVYHARSSGPCSWQQEILMTSFEAYSMEPLRKPDLAEIL